jgi:putative peptidoglycan lipid II flippase
MKEVLSKQSIVRKTLQVGISTLGSRLLGIVREILTVSYLGAGVDADAFITAWKIPNSLRKVFAEGALSVAFIPTLVELVKKGRRDEANGLMTLGFIFFEGLVLLICILVIFFPLQVVRFLAPGFSELQIAKAAPCLAVLMPFILFISSSSLFSGALQAVNHFFIPAIAPVLLNLVFIAALLICLANGLPVTFLCYCILFGGFLQFLLHLVIFWRLDFSFGSITKNVRVTFKKVLILFCNCLPSMSMMELSLAIDTWFASFLPVGTVTLFSYANRFMGIPLGVFVSAFSTVLLPHFVRLSTYAPKRQSFYLLEASKLIFWVTIPVSGLMAFFAEDIFSTIFLSDKFPLDKVQLASTILCAFVSGLFFFSLNRILLNMYYAMHNTYIPAVVSAIATVANICLNALFFETFKAPGLAYATVISTILQSGLYSWFLYKRFNFVFYFKPFFIFVVRYLAQLSVIGTAFFAAYYAIHAGIAGLSTHDLRTFLLHTWGFWLWVSPLCCIAFLALYALRSYFRIKIYFFD